MQSAPQLMPAGVLVTVPVPVPVFVTVNVGEDTVNIASTVRAVVSVTKHVDVPLQAPCQPPNTDPGDAAANNPRLDPTGTLSVQAVVHVRPPPWRVIVPVPPPDCVIVS